MKRPKHEEKIRVKGKKKLQRKIQKGSTRAPAERSRGIFVGEKKNEIGFIFGRLRFKLVEDIVEA